MNFNPADISTAPYLICGVAFLLTVWSLRKQVGIAMSGGLR